MAIPRSAVAWLVAAVAATTTLALVPGAGAHTQKDGKWTFRYFTRDLGDNLQTHCINGTGSIDPLTIVFRYYGEAGRTFSHATGDTDWFRYSELEHSPQAICGLNEATGKYSDVHGETDEAEGHGVLETPVRAHFRIWSAPHPHDTPYERWSTADPHHERYGVRNERPTHVIDEPWGDWEAHLAREMGDDGHNVYIDHFYRGAPQTVQGHPDNGLATRVGGCHGSNCTG